MFLSSKSLAFVLVICSALIHASWNVAARSLKGNMSILIMAHGAGAIMSIPFVFMYGDIENSFANINMYRYLVPSLLFHGSYMGLLAVAYYYGDVGLVYPLARGTAITLATLAVQFLDIGAPLSVLEHVGVAVVICGILTLAYDAYQTILDKKDYALVAPIDSESDVEHEEFGLERGIEMSDTSTRSPVMIKEKDLELEEKESSLKVRKGRGLSLDTTKSVNDINELTAESTKKVTYSIVFALLVGCCTASYSINDSYGVNTVPAIMYSFLFNFGVASMYLPFLYFYKYDELVDAIQTKWKYLLLMAPATTGAYLIILFVFEIPGVNIALVVCLREFSVLIGTVLAICILKEQASMLKLFGVCIICLGMGLIKLA